MRNGTRAFSIPWSTDLYIDDIEYDDYETLPPAAKVELCRIEADVYLESWPDATNKERHRVKKYARLGYSVYEYAPELYNASDLLSAIRLWEEEKPVRTNPISSSNFDDLPF